MIDSFLVKVFFGKILEVEVLKWVFELGNLLI